MFDLKPLSAEAIPAALEKAMRYRLLNEPGEAESVCHDVLRTDPDNQEALVTLLLALTRSFRQRLRRRRARRPARSSPACAIPTSAPITPAFSASGAGKAQLHRGSPGSGFEAYELPPRSDGPVTRRAEAIRPPGNDDALLRWNACARIIMQKQARTADRGADGNAVGVIPRDSSSSSSKSSSHQGP